MTTLILVSIILLSISANIMLIWYIKRLFQKIFFISDNIGDLLSNLEGFATHLEKIHSLETYYGDETLQGLIRHSRNIVEYIEGYKDVYNFTEEQDNTTEEENAKEI